MADAAHGASGGGGEWPSPAPAGPDPASRAPRAERPASAAPALPGEEIDSNPNGLLVRHRSQLVTDAGGNDLLKVDHKGRISVVAAFPPRVVPAPPGIPDLPPEIPLQAVPTSVVKGPGGVNVFRVVPGKTPKVYAGGFTNIIDIAFDHAYITNNSILSDAGQVVKVAI